LFYLVFLFVAIYQTSVRLLCKKHSSRTIIANRP